MQNERRVPDGRGRDGAGHIDDACRIDRAEEREREVIVRRRYPPAGPTRRAKKIGRLRAARSRVVGERDGNEEPRVHRAARTVRADGALAMLSYVVAMRAALLPRAIRGLIGAARRAFIATPRHAPTRPSRARGHRASYGEGSTDMADYIAIPIFLVVLSLALTAVLYWGGFVEERRNAR